MKKLLAFALALIMMLTCLAACGKKGSDETTENTDGVTVVDSDETTENTENIENTDGVTVADIEAAIAEAYGEEYLCTETMPLEYITETYGVNSEWIADYIGKMPMISFNVDTFIAIKATAGNADNVEKALTDYRDYVVENALNYPSNEPKINATRVYKLGDYVFYICLGMLDTYTIDEQYGFGPDSSIEEMEAKYAEIAVANNQKAIDKIDELLKK